MKDELLLTAYAINGLIDDHTRDRAIALLREVTDAVDVDAWPEAGEVYVATRHRVDHRLVAYRLGEAGLTVRVLRELQLGPFEEIRELIAL